EIAVGIVDPLDDHRPMQIEQDAVDWSTRGLIFTKSFEKLGFQGGVVRSHDQSTRIGESPQEGNELKPESLRPLDESARADVRTPEAFDHRRPAEEAEARCKIVNRRVSL